MSFVHLHTHTEYSLIDGAAMIKPLIARAKELEMPSLAITDHGVMYGAIDFYQRARAAEIKPIIGCEIYFTPESRLEKDANKRTLYHLVLLAKNNEGYQNLLKICSHAATEGFYHRPRVDAEILERYNTGLIATSACMFGAVSTFIEQGDLEQARKWAAYYAGVYGEENFYLEIQNHGSVHKSGVSQKQLCDGISSLAQEMGLGLVATNDVHYISDGDEQIQEYLTTIKQGKLLDEPGGMKAFKELYLKSREQMEEFLGAFPEALDNTLAIADKCNVELDFSQSVMPVFDIPDAKSEREYLRELCIEGLKKRYKDGVIPQESIERLDFELDIVDGPGFCPYFLIVADFTHWALDRDIAVGPGRGSAAGSIIAYSLNITDLDPLEHGLLFERFLNPERVEMPDIDMDFETTRRDEVINYVREKYGYDRVTQVITYNKLKPRLAIADMTRIMQESINVGSTISAQVPALGYSFNDVMFGDGKDKNKIPKFMELYNDKNNPIYKTIIDAARSIEGYIRNEGVHPCAVIISREDINEYAPVKAMKKGNNETINVTQYDGETLSSMGMLKMDFLGLRNLSVIKDAIKSIERNYGVVIDKDEIPLDDPKTFEFLGTAQTAGIFQVESGGMRALLRRMQPKQFADIVAVLALFRPGPLGSGMVDDFVERMHGKRQVKYYDERLKPILEDTYGAIVYQEQVMQISMEMSGFSPGEADALRKAMGKKKIDVLIPKREKWVNGAIERGYDGKMAAQLWEDILPFAEYAFNKSHSAAYGLITMRTAYLKAHYPGDTMAAVLTSVFDKPDRISTYIQDCKEDGIAVLPPDINKSGVYFNYIPDEGIRYGLAGIKGVGDAVVESILEAREADGPFSDIYDFVERVDPKATNKRILEALIKGGAFDSTGYPRLQLFNIVGGGLMKQMADRQQARAAGQLSMFEMFDEGDLGIADKEEPEGPEGEWPRKFKLAHEKEVLGMYVSDHPLSDYAKELRENSDMDIASEEIPRNFKGKFAGILTGVEVRVSSRGNRYARGQIEDLTGTLPFVAFADTIKAHENLLANDKVVAMAGDYKVDAEGPTLMVRSMKELVSSMDEEQAHKLLIKVKHDQMNAGAVADLRRTLVQFPGRNSIEIHVVEPRSNSTTVLAMGEQVNAGSDQLQSRLSGIFGPEAISVA